MGLLILSGEAGGDNPKKEALLKVNKEIECLMDAMISEQGGETEYEKVAFLNFFTANARKKGKSWCQEFFSKQSGGAHRYSGSLPNNLSRVKREKGIKIYYEKQAAIINNYIQGRYRNDTGLDAASRMEYCTEIKHFVKNATWQKINLTDAIRIGKTVYHNNRWSGDYNDKRYKRIMVKYTQKIISKNKLERTKKQTRRGS